MTRYVGVDLHRRRSVIVVLEADGAELWTRRIDNDPLTLGLEIEAAGPEPEVVLEATWGWYWAADVITEAGGRVHLAHPLGIAGFENRRVKNDRVDARLLADLLRMRRLPESWIPPESVRHQRELVRYRRKLSQLRAGLKAQIHAVLGKEGLLPPINHPWGPGGSQGLDETDMAEAYETRVRSLRRLIKLYDTEIGKLDARIAAEFKGHVGCTIESQAAWISARRWLETNRLAAGTELHEQIADLDDPLWVQPVRRLVQDQQVRVGKQRHRDA